MLELKYIYLCILTLLVLWIISSYLRLYKKVVALKKTEQRQEQRQEQKQEPIMVQGGFSHPLYLSSMIRATYTEATPPPLIFKMNT